MLLSGGTRAGERNQRATQRLSTDVTVRKQQYRIGTVTRVSTPRRMHNFIFYLSSLLLLFTFTLAVARPGKVRLSHCVRIQTVYQTQ